MGDGARFPLSARSRPNRAWLPMRAASVTADVARSYAPPDMRRLSARSSFALLVLAMLGGLGREARADDALPPFGGDPLSKLPGSIELGGFTFRPLVEVRTPESVGAIRPSSLRKQCSRRRRPPPFSLDPTRSSQSVRGSASLPNAGPSAPSSRFRMRASTARAAERFRTRSRSLTSSPTKPTSTCTRRTAKSSFVSVGRSSFSATVGSLVSPMRAPAVERSTPRASRPLQERGPPSVRGHSRPSAPPRRERRRRGRSSTASMRHSGCRAGFSPSKSRASRPCRPGDRQPVVYAVEHVLAVGPLFGDRRGFSYSIDGVYSRKQRLALPDGACKEADRRRRRGSRLEWEAAAAVAAAVQRQPARVCLRPRRLPRIRRSRATDGQNTFGPDPSRYDAPLRSIGLRRVVEPDHRRSRRRDLAA